MNAGSFFTAMDAETFNVILAGLLALLTALVSTFIVDAIKERRRLKDVPRTILAELQDLQVRLAILANHLVLGLGDLDRDFVRWFISEVDRLPHIRRR